MIFFPAYYSVVVIHFTKKNTHWLGGRNTVNLCESPALAGIELEEHAEAVAQMGVIFSDWIVPQQNETG